MHEATRSTTKDEYVEVSRSYVVFCSTDQSWSILRILSLTFNIIYNNMGRDMNVYNSMCMYTERVDRDVKYVY